LRFDVAPEQAWSGSNWMVRGSVTTVDRNDNYRLSNSDVVLQWRTNSGPWTYLAVPAGSNGDFDIEYPVSEVIDVRACNASGPLPASSPVTPIPEPAAACCMAAIAALSLRRRP